MPDVDNSEKEWERWREDTTRLLLARVMDVPPERTLEKLNSDAGQHLAQTMLQVTESLTHLKMRWQEMEEQAEEDAEIERKWKEDYPW